MLKIAAAAKYAQKRAEAVLAKKKARELKWNIKENLRTRVNIQRQLKERKVKSRAEEMEDRLLGPLAPRRVANDEERQLQGALTQDELMPLPILEKDRIKYWNIVPGDRVVIIKGVDKHKIGTVKSLQKQSNTLVVEGLNMVNVQIPDYFRAGNPDTPAVLRREMPLHYNDVRLVYPLPDPTTGEIKDTIIANLVTTGVFFDRKRQHGGWKRMVANSDIIIPWPKGEKKQYVDEKCDTTMMWVEFPSFTPSLITPPFPLLVVDELRNKFSKFRTRHDPEWLAGKEKQLKEQEAKRQIVRTPIQELNRKIRLEKKALGPPILTPEVLENIGRVMAQSNPASLDRVRTNVASGSPSISG